MTLIRVVLICLTLIPCAVDAQQSECNQLSGTPAQRRASYGTIVGFNTEPQLASYDLSVLGDTLTVGLALHLVGRSDGSGLILEATLQQGLSILQEAFDQARIRFVVLWRDTILSDYFASATVASEEALASALNKPNLINLYYKPSVVGGGGLAAFSESVMEWYNIWLDSACRRNSQYIMIGNLSAGTTTEPHEMGHYFDLAVTVSRTNPAP